MLISLKSHFSETQNVLVHDNSSNFSQSLVKTFSLFKLF